jgi:phage terminase large subunit-like protein
MSLLEVVRRLPDKEAAERIRVAERLEADRYFPTAREAQQPPCVDRVTGENDWTVWLIVAGRGFGKTRVGAEWITDMALTYPATRWAVLAPTFADCRDTCVEGESGILSVLQRRGWSLSEITWNRSLGELALPNKSRIKLFSTDEPERLRGPQHHGAWCDEPASWQRGTEAWDMLSFGLRLGSHPQTVVTGTPKPVPLVRDLIGRAQNEGGGVCLTRGSTFDNAANLAPAAVEELRRRYEGTRLGRQELEAELLEDVQGALWTLAAIEQDRIDPGDTPSLHRIVVAIDPSGGDGEGNDEQGIVIAGVDAQGEFYVLADATCKLSPEGWASTAVAAYRQWRADRIVAEVNFGYAMVASTIRHVDPNVPVREVHASRNKVQRAEPIAALYEQHRVHHVGLLAQLEDQMCTWVPGQTRGSKSPDRMDALVWALTDLSERTRASTAQWVTLDRAEPGWSEPSMADTPVTRTGRQTASPAAAVGGWSL